MSDADRESSTFILPPGTQVVVLTEVVGPHGRTLHPRGSVAVVVKSPNDLEHSYRVKLTDGYETSLKQHEVVVLSRFKEGEMETVVPSLQDELFNCVIFRCIIGSRAYGLDGPESDVDYRGIYLPSAERHWSLAGVPDAIENDATQEAYWEIQKFIVLALKANPNVLECLYTPLIEHSTPLADELLAMRECFLSRLIYQTFNGYVMSQFKKMQADIRNHGQVKWKHVMHLLRLLISGTHALRHREIPVRVEEHRERLLEIKAGKVAWEETERWRLELHTEFEGAFGTTGLPERPDYERANRFLLHARKSALDSFT